MHSLTKLFKKERVAFLSHMKSVIHLLRYLQNSEPQNMDWSVEYLKENGVIQIVPWRFTKDSKWALHLDLTKFKKPGQQAIIPFPWKGQDTPTVLEAVEMFRRE